MIEQADNLIHKNAINAKDEWRGEEQNMEVVKTSQSKEEAGEQVDNQKLIDWLAQGKSAKMIDAHNQLIYDFSEYQLEDFLAKLKTYPERHKLSWQTVRILLERSFRLSEQFDNPMHIDNYLIDLDEAIQLRENFQEPEDITSGDVDKYSLIEKAAYNTKDLAKQYPKSALALWKKITDHSAVAIRPEKFIDLVAEINIDPEISGWIKRDAIETLMELINDIDSYKNSVVDYVKNNLNSFHRTYKIICILNSAQTIAERMKKEKGWQWVEKAIQTIPQIFQEIYQVVEQYNDNFLLKDYLENLLNKQPVRQEYKDCIAVDNIDDAEQVNDFRIENKELNKNFSFQHLVKDGQSYIWGVNERYGRNNWPKNLYFKYGTSKLSPEFEGAYNLISGDLIKLGQNILNYIVTISVCSESSSVTFK